MTNKNVFILTATDRESLVTDIMGAFTTRYKAVATMAFWIFDGGETAEYHTEQCADNPSKEQFVTDKTIYEIEDIEVDYMM